MVVTKPQFGFYLCHCVIGEMRIVISHDRFGCPKPRDNMVQCKKCYSDSIIREGRHGLDPLTKVVQNQSNVVMSIGQSWIILHKVNVPFSKGFYKNHLIKLSRVSSIFFVNI